MLLKFLYKLQKYDQKTISINGKRFYADIADTWIKRAIGLMYRKSLKKSSCMFFIFGRDGYHAIWMYNMLFPIDVIWLDKKMKIIDYIEDIKPCKGMDCDSYAPKAKASFVVELNSGAIKENKISRDSAVKLIN